MLLGALAGIRVGDSGLVTEVSSLWGRGVGEGLMYLVSRGFV